MKKFKPNLEDQKCAPSKTYSEKSCFTLDSLKRMASAYNNKFKKLNPIEIKDDKKYLINELTKRLEDVCDDQICWLKQDFIIEMNDEEINEKTFRPLGPKGRFSWFNTTNINEIMAQYQEKYSDFIYLGAVPLDFDNLDIGIRDLNFDNLIKAKKSKIGIVFNFDRHWQRGSHWVSMYADLLKNQVYYFDSYGKPPKKEIRNFVNRICKWCYTKNILNEDLETSMTEQSFMKPKRENYIERELKNIKFNKIRHQYKTSECGTYSINIILRLLKGEKFEDICENITTDDEVNKCREKYFRFI
jgi:hypothetical protein